MQIKPTLLIAGFEVYKGLLGPEVQGDMVACIRKVAAAAPLFSPMTPYGKPMSVRMTSAGQFGWYSDKSGYRYVDRHPNGEAWPQIPEQILDVWRCVSGRDQLPDSCLINFYGPAARMGMHQDKDEEDFGFPVVSISLGDDGMFRIGGEERGGKTQSIWLNSGDVVVMGGAARLAYHGVDKIRPNTSTLLKDSGRINVTLRMVKAPK